MGYDLRVLSFIIAAHLAAPRRVELVFAGDIMLNGILPKVRPLSAMAGLLHGDLTFANLEVPLTTAKGGTSRKSPEEVKRRDQWILKASPDHAKEIAEVGIDAVTVANNHAMDYGAAGLSQMLQALDGVGVSHAGAGRNSFAANRPALLTTDGGARVGFLSALAFMTRKALEKCTPATADASGVAVLALDGRLDKPHRERLAQWIAKAKRGADLVVVGVHWGTERQTVPNPWQVALGRALVDAGADVVWGHHPHVLQGAEMYKGRPILYSMGNLISNLPAETGVMHVTARRGAYSLRFLPARISKGRVTPVKVSPINFRALCEAIQRKYPNRESRSGI